MSVEIIETNAQIERLINKALAKELTQLIRRRSNRIKKDIKAAVPTWLFSQPEMVSLLAKGQGTLNAQFGLPPGVQILSIIDAVADSITTEFTTISPVDLSGGISFLIQPSDFRNVLSLPAGSIITEKGTKLDWLEWLLTAGDSVIVAGYQYSPEDGGRSGGGVMKPGSAFRVSPAFSGTIDNNFITRAFRGREDQLSKIIARGLK